MKKPFTLYLCIAMSFVLGVVSVLVVLRLLPQKSSLPDRPISVPQRETPPSAPQSSEVLIGELRDDDQAYLRGIWKFDTAPEDRELISRLAPLISSLLDPSRKQWFEPTSAAPQGQGRALGAFALASRLLATHCKVAIAEKRWTDGIQSYSALVSMHHEITQWGVREGNVWSTRRLVECVDLSKALDASQREWSDLFPGIK